MIGIWFDTRRADPDGAGPLASGSSRQRQPVYALGRATVPAWNAGVHRVSGGVGIGDYSSLGLVKRRC